MYRAIHKHINITELERIIVTSPTIHISRILGDPQTLSHYQYITYFTHNINIFNICKHVALTWDGSTLIYYLVPTHSFDPTLSILITMLLKYINEEKNDSQLKMASNIYSAKACPWYQHIITNTKPEPTIGCPNWNSVIPVGIRCTGVAGDRGL